LRAAYGSAASGDLMMSAINKRESSLRAATTHVEQLVEAREGTLRGKGAGDLTKPSRWGRIHNNGCAHMSGQNTTTIFRGLILYSTVSRVTDYLANSYLRISPGLHNLINMYTLQLMGH
jgi:hypothetical protein